FTPNQYNQILRILNKDKVPEVSANMAGILCCSYKITSNEHDCIFDTCATNHMVSKSEMLSKICKLPNHESRKVHLPNGNKIPIAHIGSCRLDQENISNVLCVPDFRYKFLSVSKLTKELNRCMEFFRDFCLTQDLHNVR
ncbi:hypothetical protein A4A49_60051, partial [Nicotiana attenuata]